MNSFSALIGHTEVRMLYMHDEPANLIEHATLELAFPMFIDSSGKNAFAHLFSCGIFFEEILVARPKSSPKPMLGRMDGYAVEGCICFAPAMLIHSEIRATQGDRIEATLKFKYGERTEQPDRVADYIPLPPARIMTWDDVPEGLKGKAGML